MKQEALNKILKDHKLWLKDNNKGKRAYLSGADLSGADLSGADLYRADLSGANLREADLSEANLRGADLYRADLMTANLSGANIYGANLRGVDLSEACLNGADLRRSTLRGANLIGSKGILSFTGSQNLLVYFKYANIHYFKIGCMTYNRELWLENFESIGKDQDYSDSEIEIYGTIIKAMSKINL